MAKTFFIPWRRLGEVSSNRWNFFEVFASFVVTSAMRIVGMMTRTIVITFGFISLVTVFVLELAFFAVWITTPVIMLFILYLGVSLLLR
ncbi:MAG: hypothetical protein HZA94_01290 [Candidatus Vogelbacteria bacterium]|nr:hypothetical protein [Candidatus Vogelbacteria bacterium]